jgi:hypothetical protein
VIGTAAAALFIGACGGNVSIFNSAAVNTFVGGQTPVTPGPAAAFVLVRALNETGQIAEFIITIERDVLVRDDAGNLQVDELGSFITRPERETVRLTTGATGNATDMGVLFSCDESPIKLIGLGEDLLPTNAAVFVGGSGAGGTTGFGVTAGDLNPLSLESGNFNCGDTVIFRAFRSPGVAGGVDLQSFLLPGSEQPSIFTGPSTFSNLAAFLQSQIREDEP